MKPSNLKPILALLTATEAADLLAFLVSLR